MSRTGRRARLWACAGMADVVQPRRVKARVAARPFRSPPCREERHFDRAGQRAQSARLRTCVIGSCASSWVVAEPVRVG